MRRKTVSPVGALHPILFFAGVYAVALFFSIFICSTIFYSCNASSMVKTEKGKETTAQTTAVASLR